MARKKRYKIRDGFRECVCGCEKPIPKTSKRKYYEPACRVRAARDRRAKGIPAKPTGRNNPRPPDPVQQEIDVIEELWIRRMIEKGEMTPCDRCGTVFLIISGKTNGPYCSFCTAIMSPLAET